MRRDQSLNPPNTLRSGRPGVAYAVTGPVAATPGVRRRLAELGVREGTHVMLRSRTSGGGAILAVGDARLAVSGRLLAAIPVTAEASAEPASTHDARKAAS